jgi:hypothetical protein
MRYNVTVLQFGCIFSKELAMAPEMLPPPRPRAPQTIRIDPDVWFALQKLAVPFIETPNDVLRRLLGLGNPATSNDAALVSGTTQIQDVKEKRRALYFINTDAKTNGRSFHSEWLARGIAVTSGPGRFRDKLARIGHGDTVLMYVNAVGVVAVGITLDDRVQDVVGKGVVSPVEATEYHRRVRWQPLPTPISPATIKELCGQTPLQTVQRVRKGEDELRRLLPETASALSSAGD